MIGIGCLLLLLTMGTPQDSSPRPPQRQGSANVSAGISKEQLAAEGQLNGVLERGDQARRSGDPAGAIRQFERARDMVRSDKLLAEQQDRVLDRLGGAYLNAGRAPDAVATYTALLELRHSDCRPGSDSPSQCADAKQSLGYSKMLAGDFDGALPVLRDAEARFGAAAKPGDSEEYRNIEVKKQAEVRLLVSAALFRTGKRQEAITITESAIEQLKKVESNESIQQSIRGSAANSLAQAEKQLDLMKH
jgi:tetratricopeptide (TPR) repeat protein